MSKTLADFTPEQKSAWAESPITQAVAVELTRHRDRKAKGYMLATGPVDEKERGYFLGMTEAIRMLGGDA